MSLAPGVFVGPYEIVGRIGAGGMGEVFRARDAKLHRDVALKVLPDAFATDGDRLERFEREAVVLASLNHPNIAQIHGLEEAGSRKALVLELVEGLTLTERIAVGPVPLDEALVIARQIADALGAAHESGVIHRDLKPSNVKLRPDGVVKVLDFGLAKVLDAPAAVSADIAASPTLTSPVMTEQGVILGTAAYMAPEQARGKSIDERADIWAFGVVLFEMLTGKRLFAGEDLSETLAAVLKVQPDFGEAPEQVRRVLRRCLEKDPRRRLHDIHDVWDLLDEPVPAAGPSGSLLFRNRWWAATAGVAVAAAAFVAGMRMGPDGETVPESARRFRIEMPASVTLPSVGPQIALSPNGHTLVFRAQAPDGVARLYRRPLDSLEATPIPGTEGVRYQGPPFFSPDGQWLAFLVGSRLMKVNLGGGQPEPVADLPRGKGVLDRTGWNWGGGTWSSDGTLVLALFEAGLVRVPATGGDVEVLTETEGTELWFQHPQLLRNGRAVLFTSTMGLLSGELRVFDLDTRSLRTLTRGTAGRVLPTGHLVFVRAGALWAVRFDSNGLEMVGDPKPVELGVRSGGLGAAWVAVSGDGSLAYVAGPGIPPPADTIVWVDRRGVETPIQGFPAHLLHAIRLSPTDDRVAMTTSREDSMSIQVWDFAGLAPLTTLRELHRFPTWPSNGRHIVYSVQRDGREDVYWQPWDRPAQLRPLTPVPERGAVPMTFSPDGTRLVTQTASAPPVTNVLRLGADLAQPATVEGSFVGGLASVSRDGRWIAYQTNASGRPEVWVRPFPDVTARGRQVSIKGGLHPIWSRGTDELFFVEQVSPRQLMAIPVNADTTLADTWDARPVFRMDPYVMRVWRNYDVSADGQRFLMTKAVSAAIPAEPPAIVLVQNWFEELNRLVPPN